MVYKVIDVSYHNGIIDWNKVKEDGVDGAIIRCGYGDNIAAQDDKQWRRNADECTRLGIPFGVYLYSYAKSSAQARSEAEHVLRLIKGYRLSYPVYCDLEEAGCEAYAVQNAIIFGDMIEQAGYWCGIYANNHWFNSVIKDKLDRFTKWIARYSSNKPDKACDMWQYTSSGRVDGVSGVVDINECYRNFPKETGSIPGINNHPAQKKDDVQEFLAYIASADVHRLASEVMAGKYGDGAVRKVVLGNRYEEVQAVVNRMNK